MDFVVEASHALNPFIVMIRLVSSLNVEGASSDMQGTGRTEWSNGKDYGACKMAIFSSAVLVPVAKAISRAKITLLSVPGQRVQSTASGVCTRWHT